MFESRARIRRFGERERAVRPGVVVLVLGDPQLQSELLQFIIVNLDRIESGSQKCGGFTGKAQ